MDFDMAATPPDIAVHHPTGLMSRAWFVCLIGSESTLWDAHGRHLLQKLSTVCARVAGLTAPHKQLNPCGLANRIMTTKRNDD
jgi:hypothetical protein